MTCKKTRRKQTTNKKTTGEEANTIFQSDKMVGIYSWKRPHRLIQITDFRGKGEKAQKWSMTCLRPLAC